MRHLPDGVLRRLDDEPLAVPDRVTDHLDGCERCRARRAGIAHDSEGAARLLAAPAIMPDLDAAWAGLVRDLDRADEGPTEAPADLRPPRTPVVARRPRFHGLSLRAGLAVAAIAVAVVGTAAAATLTTIFAPTHVAAVPVTQHDLRAIAAFTGLGDGTSLAGFTTSSGSTTLRFGTIAWSSSPAQPVPSRAQAIARAGVPIALPVHMPAGVAGAPRFVVAPRMSATVTFNAKAASLAGSSVTIGAGPAAIAEYPAATGPGVPALVVTTMRRPTAQSTSASTSQIEAFLLDQPGLPPELAEEVRLLGDLRTTLPVPVPSGASVRSVKVGGWPGVLLVDGSNAAAGVVWEDGHGLLHGVAGLLDAQDVLNVAEQVS